MHRIPNKLSRRTAALGLSAVLARLCSGQSKNQPPTIEFTRIPQADEGGRAKHDIVQGHVKGARPGQQIVLYSKSGIWWVQPMVNHSFTRLNDNGTWVNATHLGLEYAALLVDSGYRPAATLNALPAVGGPVAAVASVKGSATSPSPSISFSGYEWRMRTAPSDRGGARIPYDPSNISVDSSGALHLRVRRAGDGWSCSELSLVRSLGYGTYSFVVREISHLEPAAVFGMFTWDYSGASESYHEFSVEISRWGDPASKNAQYVVQPYYVPANVDRFMAPAGVLTHRMQWEPGRLTCRTLRGSGPNGTRIAEHVFTSGVPAQGIESVRMNLYVFPSGPVKLSRDAEVVIEKFSFLP